MATLQVTARKAQQALNGQSVRVYVNSTEVTTKLPYIVAGDTVGIVSSGFQGTVLSVDSYGTSFLCKPVALNKNLSSISTPGYLANGEQVNIN